MRALLENELDVSWPKWAPKHISMAPVKDMMALDFDSGDSWLSFQQRANGFLVYSVYPLEDREDPMGNRL